MVYIIAKGEIKKYYRFYVNSKERSEFDDYPVPTKAYLQPAVFGTEEHVVKLAMVLGFHGFEEIASTADFKDAAKLLLELNGRMFAVQKMQRAIVYYFKRKYRFGIVETMLSEEE
jgi:hypothetical protein